jgi:hypothetical protein
MPSTSPSQKRLMAAAAHTPGGYGGVSQSVGKEFNRADQAKGHKKGGPIEPITKDANPTGKSGWKRWGKK